MTDEERAKLDAFDDIAESESEGGIQVRCHFGSAIVIKDDEEVTGELVNILIPNYKSHEEAFAATHLTLSEIYPSKDGWQIGHLKIEKEVVWADPQRFKLYGQPLSESDEECEKMLDL